MLVTHGIVVHTVHSQSIRLCWLDYVPEFTSSHIHAFLSAVKQLDSNRLECLFLEA